MWVNKMFPILFYFSFSTIVLFLLTTSLYKLQIVKLLDISLEWFAEGYPFSKLKRKISYEALGLKCIWLILFLETVLCVLVFLKTVVYFCICVCLGSKLCIFQQQQICTCDGEFTCWVLWVKCIRRKTGILFSASCALGKYHDVWIKYWIIHATNY